MLKRRLVRRSRRTRADAVAMRQVSVQSVSGNGNGHLAFVADGYLSNVAGRTREAGGRSIGAAFGGGAGDQRKACLECRLVKQGGQIIFGDGVAETAQIDAFPSQDAGVIASELARIEAEELDQKGGYSILGQIRCGLPAAAGI